MTGDQQQQFLAYRRAFALCCMAAFHESSTSRCLLLAWEKLVFKQYGEPSLRDILRND
jgi:hypothetical protein